MAVRPSEANPFWAEFPRIANPLLTDVYQALTGVSVWLRDGALSQSASRA